MSGKKKAVATLPQKVATKLDGWINVLTGLGIRGKDKKASASIVWCRPEEQDLEEFYAADALARKVVDLPVFEALNKGFKVCGFEQAENELITEAGEKLKVLDKVAQAWSWARLYGGAGLLLATDGLAKPEAPMDDKEKLKAMNVLTRFELWINFDRLQKDILKANYGSPEYFQFQPALASSTVGLKTSANTINIHHSRIVTFEGLKLPKRMKIRNSYWDDSVLTALRDSIKNYQTSHGSAASVIDDFSIGVFKIKNLASQIASDGDDAVVARMQILNLTRSIARAIVVDSEGEDFTYQSRSIAGLPELISKAESHLVAETNIPNTVLFGNSPVGLGGSGNHELNNWYDYLKSEQENYLKPKLIQIYKHLAIDLGLDPNKVSIEFNPLWQMDEKEEAEVEKIIAEKDAIYITAQVLDPDEVAQSRFGGEKYSKDTELQHERGQDFTASTQSPDPLVKTDASPTETQTLIFSKKQFPTSAEALKWATDHNFNPLKGADETSDSFRVRLIDPSQFKPKSFRTIELKNGVSAVIGKRS